MMTSAQRRDLQTAPPASASALLRHFADLRDGTHGDASWRHDKERLFGTAVSLLDPHPGRRFRRSTRICCSAPAR